MADTGCCRQGLCCLTPANSGAPVTAPTAQRRPIGSDLQPTASPPLQRILTDFTESRGGKGREKNKNKNGQLGRGLATVSRGAGSFFNSLFPPLPSSNLFFSSITYRIAESIGTFSNNLNVIQTPPSRLTASLPRMLRRYALGFSSVGRQLSTMSSSTPMEDVIRAKVSLQRGEQT